MPPQSKKKRGETTNEYVVRLEIQAGRLDDLRRRTKNHDPGHQMAPTLNLWRTIKSKGAKLIIGGTWDELWRQDSIPSQEQLEIHIGLLDKKCNQIMSKDAQRRLEQWRRALLTDKTNAKLYAQVANERATPHVFAQRKDKSWTGDPKEMD